VNRQIGVRDSKFVVYFDPLLLQVQKIELLRVANGHLAKQNETFTLRQPRHVNAYNTKSYLNSL